MRLVHLRLQVSRSVQSAAQYINPGLCIEAEDAIEAERPPLFLRELHLIL